jgi:hypothetical protein
MEEDQAFGTGVKNVSEGEWRGLERERLGELRAEEEGTFEAEMVEGLVEKRTSVTLAPGGEMWCHGKHSWALGHGSRLHSGGYS